MIELAIVGCFASILIVGIFTKSSLVLTLGLGYLLFSGYALYKRVSAGDIFKLSLKGMRLVLKVLLLFACIGALVASWRASGTIAAITCWSAHLIQPSYVYAAIFVLTLLMSVISGSSYATSATVGMICINIAAAMQVDLALAGGAALSGALVGDRWSPLSSTAQLTSSLTHTDIFDNLKRMGRLSVVPIVVTFLFFLLVELSVQVPMLTLSFERDLAQTFSIQAVVALPAVLIIALALMRVSVIATVVISMLSACVIACTIQGYPIHQLPTMLVFGYHTTNPALANMIDGGGVITMLELMGIISIASSYTYIFEETRLLTPLAQVINALSKRSTPFVSVLATAAITTMVSCDQVVSIMITQELCSDVEAHPSALALDLTSSACVICGIIPWSTTVVGIMVFTHMPPESILFNVYVVALMLWTLCISIYQHKHPNFTKERKAHALGLDERDDVRNGGLKRKQAA